jgi:hypothetical protein
VWVNAFVGNWNSGWKVGDKVEIAKENIKSREYQGKTYYDLKAPADAKGVNLKPITDALAALTARVDALESSVYEDEGEEQWDDVPPVANKPEESSEDEIKVDDIPF